MSFKKVIQIGVSGQWCVKNITILITYQAAGSLGAPVLKGLVKGGFEVSVLARPSSKSVYQAGINVFKAEFSDHKALVEAFRGQDVVIVTAGDFYNIESTTIPLIDAAIEAGVQRFIPSGWGL